MGGGLAALSASQGGVPSTSDERNSTRGQGRSVGLSFHGLRLVPATGLLRPPATA